MTEVILSASTGRAPIDDRLRGVVGIFEMVFARRIRSYYVEGSYADGTEVTTSDLDLTVVFRDGFRDATERDTAAQLAGYCAALGGVELDIELTDDKQLAGGVYPSLKVGSLCLYGEDRRDHLRLLPLEEWTRQRMHAAYWLLVNVFHRPRRVTYPLAYPDPAGSFYGYDQRVVRLATGAEVNSTRDLVRVTGWIATALLASRAGVYVARKRDCHRAYRRHIDDAWAPLVEELYRRCRSEWGYLIPSGAAEQQMLRALCEQTLQLENHFLVVYKDYLLAELGSGNKVAQGRALWMLGQVVYHDEDVRRAVQALDGAGNSDVWQAARDTLALYHQT